MSRMPMRKAPPQNRFEKHYASQKLSGGYAVNNIGSRQIPLYDSKFILRCNLCHNSIFENYNDYFSTRLVKNKHVRLHYVTLFDYSCSSSWSSKWRDILDTNYHY